jgi:hypothetical protein
METTIPLKSPRGAQVRLDSFDRGDLERAWRCRLKWHFGEGSVCSGITGPLVGTGSP